MELYTIYESDEMTVGIPTVIHEFFKKVRIKKVSLDKKQFHVLLSYTLAFLKKKGEEFRNKEIKSSSELPVIERDKQMSLYEPFDIFEQGFDILSYATDEETLQISLESIKEIYEDDEHLYFDIFSKPLFGAHGFFALVEEKEILIAFFSLSEWENIYPE